MRWVLLFSPWKWVFRRSQGLRALRQCREGVVLSTEQWYGCGNVVMMWRWWYIDPRIETWLWTGMGWNGCGNGVKTWPTINMYLISYYIGNPSIIGSFWLYPTCIQYPLSNAHRVGVASTNRTDKFWHTGSAEEYSSEEFDGWGVRAYARVWRSYLQAILNECYFWFRQCGDVIIYVIPHYLYYDITMYGCDIRLEFG